MQHVTHIRSDEARRVHAALVTALGTETNPAQWMHFMRTVRDQLPDVLSRGRPSKAAIQASPIGALGFDTWRAMCEAPVEQRGLGLPWSQWRQWSRAWTVIQQHPSLENAPLTAAEVNRIATEAKAANEPMPTDTAAIEAFQERQSERKKAAKEETQAALKANLEALEASLAASREELARTNGAVDTLREQLAQAHTQKQQVEQRLTAEQQQRNDLQWKFVQMETRVQELQELEKELHMYRNRSFWQRLQDVFSPR